MNWKAFVPVVLAAALGVAMPAAGAGESVLDDPMTGKPVSYGGKFAGGKVTVPDAYRPKAREMRGVWVATIDNLDFPAVNNVEAFKRAYLGVVNNLQKLNFNTIIFQVRPMNDAFYPSAINPWSRWMTGTEGRPLLNFDPLAFMVEEAHKRGLEFHAWLNPYRVVRETPMRKAEYLKTLDARNFARRNPQLVLEVPKNDKNTLILNPGEPKVIRHILATVREIAEKYPVDAIHFDDYFYLYGGMGAVDQYSYRAYNPRKLSLDDWRRSNVDAVIRGVKEELTEINRRTGRSVAFGVSPFGIWANKKNNPEGSLTGGSQSYYVQYADTRGWIRNGWVDYIVPQLYWPFSLDIAPYAALADWWADAVRGTRVNLYIGQGVYRLGADKRWRGRELPDQLRYNTKRKEIDGSVLFSYRNIFNPSNAAMKEGVDKVRQYWRVPVPAPECPNVRR